uniref:Deoxynucleoside triphosphate triphosphohydrolase SAMHD1 homolog n=1 Tax=Dermatophagoides pteronyssinus TaxID=6956 RepID=A0A6P6Y7B0_DERPT|nr:deoxynucleoside triphosphate triphosphohydrolase SAMHD1 homolog [Dermatophagoides pteronyssinus]
MYGTVTFKRNIWHGVIDTPAFQRMRHIKQLGTAHYVFPNSLHSRFEHCVGVGHLSQLYYDTLGANMRIADRIPRHLYESLRDCVTIGGLCHDIGHGPYSHTFETFLQSWVRGVTSIVANNVSGIDTDRLDYVQRDGLVS